MKNLKIVLVILVLNLLASGAMADEICFTKADAAAIVTEIERCRIQVQELKLQQEANQELELQIKHLKEIIELQKQQLEISKITIEQYKNITKLQDEACEEMLKKTKKNPIKSLLEIMGSIGLGILIGVLIL